MWDMSWTRRAGCDLLECIAQQSDPEARVWRGSELPMDQQGVTILEHFWAIQILSLHSWRKIQDHIILLERILAVTDVQSLLLHCASARANCILRVVRPDLERTRSTA